MQLGERQRALVAALRSGKYSQTQRRLRKGDGFCCLGVACDISHIGEWRLQEDHEYLAYVIDEAAESAVLPRAVMEYFGFKQFAGDFVAEYAGKAIDGKTELTALNDNGWNFEAIASVIEEKAEFIFTEPK